jgi:hypothetical protein
VVEGRRESGGREEGQNTSFVQRLTCHNIHEICPENKNFLINKRFELLRWGLQYGVCRFACRGHVKHRKRLEHKMWR